MYKYLYIFQINIISRKTAYNKYMHMYECVRIAFHTIVHPLPKSISCQLHNTTAKTQLACDCSFYSLEKLDFFFINCDYWSQTKISWIDTVRSHITPSFEIYVKNITSYIFTNHFLFQLSRSGFSCALHFIVTQTSVRLEEWRQC